MLGEWNEMGLGREECRGRFLAVRMWDSGLLWLTLSVWTIIRIEARHTFDNLHPTTECFGPIFHHPLVLFTLISTEGEGEVCGERPVFLRSMIRT